MLRGKLADMLFQIGFHEQIKCTKKNQTNKKKKNKSLMVSKYLPEQCLSQQIFLWMRFWLHLHLIQPWLRKMDTKMLSYIISCCSLIPNGIKVVYYITSCKSSNKQFCSSENFSHIDVTHKLTLLSYHQTLQVQHPLW